MRTCLQILTYEISKIGGFFLYTFIIAILLILGETKIEALPLKRF